MIDEDGTHASRVPVRYWLFDEKYDLFVSIALPPSPDAPGYSVYSGL